MWHRAADVFAIIRRLRSQHVGTLDADRIIRIICRDRRRHVSVKRCGPRNGRCRTAIGWFTACHDDWGFAGGNCDSCSYVLRFSCGKERVWPLFDAIMWRRVREDERRRGGSGDGKITARLVLPHASTALTLYSRFALRKTSKRGKGEKQGRWGTTGKRRPLSMISRQINSREREKGGGKRARARPRLLPHFTHINSSTIDLTIPFINLL